MQSKIFIAAAAIGAGVMFIAPQTFATPLTAAGTQVSTVAKRQPEMEQVATRYYKKKRWAHRRHWHNNRWAGRHWCTGVMRDAGTAEGGTIATIIVTTMARRST